MLNGPYKTIGDQERAAKRIYKRLGGENCPVTVCWLEVDNTVEK